MIGEYTTNIAKRQRPCFKNKFYRNKYRDDT